MCLQIHRFCVVSLNINDLLSCLNLLAGTGLSVYLDGQRIRHECHPTYLGVTLDRTLSYREHLTKTAGKLKNRNNLLMKLAGSTCTASANTPPSSALALFYSAAEYCAPVMTTTMMMMMMMTMMKACLPRVHSVVVPVHHAADSERRDVQAAPAAAQKALESMSVSDVEMKVLTSELHIITYNNTTIRVPKNQFCFIYMHYRVAQKSEVTV